MDDVRNKKIICSIEYDKEEVILNHHSKISLTYNQSFNAGLSWLDKMGNHQ